MSIQPSPTLTQRSFETLKVGDVMQPVVVSCPPDASLHAVAALMSIQGMHSVFVFEPDGVFLGMVSDLDLVAAARAGLVTRTAGESAVTPIVTARTDDALEHAADLMVDNSLSHLCVIDPRTRTPVGVLSTIDLARVIATR